MLHTCSEPGSNQFLKGLPSQNDFWGTGQSGSETMHRRSTVWTVWGLSLRVFVEGKAMKSTHTSV